MTLDRLLELREGTISYPAASGDVVHSLMQEHGKLGFDAAPAHMNE